jgi:hypothetical protein
MKSTEKQEPDGADIRFITSVIQVNNRKLPKGNNLKFKGSLILSNNILLYEEEN